MAISQELKSKILRYAHVEQWRVGTIARMLHVHHSTVRRVLNEGGLPKFELAPKKSILEPYYPFIMETLGKYPTLTASRLYDMVRERGYPGGPDHFRHVIRILRPQPSAQAYFRLKTLPGEQSQTDWGHFGHIQIGQAKRPVMCFVMVLSYSRKMFLRFYLNSRMSNFLKGHEEAFYAFGGIPRVVLYDNLRSAVLERQGGAIRFNPTFLEFAGHYRYEPRPVNVARGNEKGRVERSIGYIRTNFFAGRTFKSIEDLNAQADLWCNNQASKRPCPEDKSRTVDEVFLEEQPLLIDLPANPYPSEERVEVSVGKTPYVRFDLNDYSIPHTFVRRTLTVSATLDEVYILNGIEMIAKHKRSYDKGQTIEEVHHVENLERYKKQARQHHGNHRLMVSVPESEAFLKAVAKKNYSLRSVIKSLVQLLDDYGAVELGMAMKNALAKQVPHPNAVRNYLEKRREEKNQYPPVHLDLPNDKRVREQVVRRHNLKDYDQLQPLLEQHNEK